MYCKFDFKGADYNEGVLLTLVDYVEEEEGRHGVTIKAMQNHFGGSHRLWQKAFMNLCYWGKARCGGECEKTYNRIILVQSNITEQERGFMCGFWAGWRNGAEGVKLNLDFLLLNHYV